MQGAESTIALVNAALAQDPRVGNLRKQREIPISGVRAEGLNAARLSKVFAQKIEDGEIVAVIVAQLEQCVASDDPRLKEN